ncbi:DUF669 domain-containing protein [Natribacillus halophilus]|uniref:DUF669 domain-containing protein n=1 Tax=Natribacillus halophilus TaxID=549003 RepID=A0A1G8RUL1_9BACI|nr:DUF669 domain-containing protein [Natribacillus halophilus]SDJ20652.1 Protein of unknown function [Natribacillus halophilus]
MLKIDYSKAGSEPVKPGEYEVLPTEYAVETARSGNQMVQFNYTIRDDVDQPSQGSKINYDNFVWTQNSLWRFQAAAKASAIPEGTEMNTPEDFGQAFKNRPLRVVVELEEQRNGREYPTVKSFKETQVGPPMNNSSAPLGQTINTNDISDSELPF